VGVIKGRIAPWLSLAMWLASLAHGCVQAAPVETPLWQRLLPNQGYVYAGPWITVHDQARVTYAQRDISTGTNTLQLIESFDAEGAPITSMAACSFCYAEAAMSDGGMWMSEWRSRVGPQGFDRWFYRRYSAQGDKLVEVEVAPQLRLWARVLRPENDVLEVLFLSQEQHGPVMLLRIDAEGIPEPLRTLAISTPWPNAWLEAHRKHEDGRLTLLISHSSICPPIQPCNDRYFAVVWLDAQREVLASYVSTAKNYTMELGRHLDEQGRMWRLHRSGASTIDLLFVDSDGVPAPLRTLDARIPMASASSEPFIGAIGGHALLRADDQLWLFDSEGQLIAHNPSPTGPISFFLDESISPHGYLLRSIVPEAPLSLATLFDPRTLAPIAHFDRQREPDEPNPTYRQPGSWSVLPDGWMHVGSHDSNGSHLAVFAIPGTPAYRPFGNGFE